MTVLLPNANRSMQPNDLDSTVQPFEPGMKCVLIVDDDQQALRFASDVLESAGYRVVGSLSSDEAVRQCASKQTPIHLLLVDMVMPNVNGHQLASQVVALQPTMRILFMSGYPALTGLLNGFVHRREDLHVETDFIQKPFTSSELTSKVRGILDRSD